MIGCTDLPAEPGIPRTRAGHERQAGAIQPTFGAADQGLRLRRRRDCHLRHCDPAALAVGRARPGAVTFKFRPVFMGALGPLWAWCRVRTGRASISSVWGRGHVGRCQEGGAPPIAGGASSPDISPSAGPWPDRFIDCHPGVGPSDPIAGVVITLSAGPWSDWIHSDWYLGGEPCDPPGACPHNVCRRVTGPRRGC